MTTTNDKGRERLWSMTHHQLVEVALASERHNAALQADNARLKEEVAEKDKTIGRITGRKEVEWPQGRIDKLKDPHFDNDRETYFYIQFPERMRNGLREDIHQLVEFLTNENIRLLKIIRDVTKELDTYRFGGHYYG